MKSEKKTFEMKHKKNNKFNIKKKNVIKEVKVIASEKKSSEIEKSNPKNTNIVTTGGITIKKSEKPILGLKKEFIKKKKIIEKEDKPDIVDKPAQISDKSNKIKKEEFWFEDIVDRALILDTVKNNHSSAKSLVTGKYSGLTRAIAIDCEFVGVGWEAKDNMLARVSVVNENGHLLLDTFVQPMEKVHDYRTAVSGVRREDIESDSAMSFKEACERVFKIINKRILVGHSVKNDLKALLLGHPKKLIRDTSTYPGFLRDPKNKKSCRSLRGLAEEILGVKIQDGEHCSIVDAQATMRLYQHVKHQWEQLIRTGTQHKPDEKTPTVISEDVVPEIVVPLDPKWKQKHESYRDRRKLHWNKK